MDDATLQHEINLLRQYLSMKYREAYNAFRALDRDCSGKISAYELKKGTRFFNLPIPHEHIMQIAAIIAGSDGQIDYDTFCKKLFTEHV